MDLYHALIVRRLQSLATLFYMPTSAFRIPATDIHSTALFFSSSLSPIFYVLFFNSLLLPVFSACKVSRVLAYWKTGKVSVPDNSTRNFQKKWIISQGISRKNGSCLHLFFLIVEFYIYLSLWKLHKFSLSVRKVTTKNLSTTIIPI